MRALARVVAVLTVLAVLAFVADRVALQLSEEAVAARVQTSAGLVEPPGVEIRGVPFLTQALRGRYSDVVVRADRASAGTLPVERFVAELRGVQLPLSDVLQDRARPVPVDTLTARAVLPYAAITAAVADRGLSVAPAGEGLVRVTGTFRLLGDDVEVAAVSRAGLDGDRVVLAPERFETGVELADDVLTRLLGDRLDVGVPIGELPYGLRVTGLSAGADGVVLQARSDGAVLPPA